MKKKKIYYIIAVIVLIISIATFSYALWGRKFTQTGQNVINTGCFNVTFQDGDAINLTNTYPLADVAGKKLDGYTFTVKNTCTTAAIFEPVFITENMGFSSNEIKFYVEGDKTVEPALLSSVKVTNEDKYVLFRDYLSAASSKNGNDGQSKTYTLKMWINSSAGNDRINQTMSGKISIEAASASNTLYNSILASNSVITETPNFTIGEPPINGTNTGSGLYATSDDDGVSYYFRGDINNNYVSFANLTWRIIRINGDGSIRIMSEKSYSGYDAYNNGLYTQNNEHECTKDNPCTKDSGTSSDLKTKLESWYDTTLKNYDDKIVLSSFCNDTSFENGNTNYNPNVRTQNGTPILTCPNPQSNNGGLYKLKVGLISADEMNLAGLIWWADDHYNSSQYPSYSNNYLVTGKNVGWMSFSPNYPNDNSLLVANDEFIDSDYAPLVRPVINLKSTVKVARGDGSKNNPYVIE